MGIELLDSESGGLRIAATVGYPPDVDNDALQPLGEGITGWVAQHGEPILAPDVRLDSHYTETVSDTRSELCVPLVAGSQVIGVINVESPQLNAFTDDHLRLLSTLASNLTIVVELARMVDNLEQMVNERTAELQESIEERARLQQEIIETQKQVIQELSTPVIPTHPRC